MASGSFLARCFNPFMQIYADLYELYHTLHEAFGLAEGGGSLGHVMKQLLEIRDRPR